VNAASRDVKDLLAGESALALTPGDDLHISEMPSTPDACISVHDSGGPPPSALFTLERPTVQVRVRAEKGHYEAGHATAAAIRDLLNGMHGFTLNGSRYISIFATSDVIPLGNDQNRRPEFTVNFQIQRTSSP
jgi:hypothetical protein